MAHAHTQTESSPANNAIGTRVLAWGIAFAVVYIVARMVLAATDLHLGWRIALAVSPIPLFGLWLFHWVRAVRAADELERRIQLEALALAFPLALLLLMALGMVQLVVPLPEADFSYRHVWAMLPIFYFLGLALARRRYS